MLHIFFRCYRCTRYSYHSFTFSLDEYVPIIKRTVCYIVAAVLFNDSGQVLLIQEAKQSCYGQWYLPAGRVEPNETLEVRYIRLCYLFHAPCCYPSVDCPGPEDLSQMDRKSQW